MATSTKAATAKFADFELDLSTGELTRDGLDSDSRGSRSGLLRQAKAAAAVPRTSPTVPRGQAERKESFTKSDYSQRRTSRKPTLQLIEL